MADIGLRRAPMIIMIALPAAAAASCAYFGFALTEAILWVVLILMLIADRQRSTYHVHGLSGWDSGDGTVVDKTARMWQVVEYIERMENMMRHFEAADDMEVKYSPLSGYLTVTNSCSSAVVLSMVRRRLPSALFVMT